MHIVLVSGLSGSGKSIALKVLEDDGYYCVDNLPATLLEAVLDFLASAGHSRVGVSVDARSAALAALPERVGHLRSRGIDCRVIFLEAATATLLRRFSETRRRHPLVSADRTLAEAIATEQSRLAEVAELGHRIDTSDLRPQVLRQWVRDLLGLGQTPLALVFCSFAFREGLPLDADWVVDTRMLPNPHYEPALRPLDGRDPAVAAFLDAQPAAQAFLADLRMLLERWLPDIVRDSRSALTVSVGCTGGRHRSVYIVERLADAFRGQWPVIVRHRGLSRSTPTGLE